MRNEKRKVDKIPEEDQATRRQILHGAEKLHARHSARQHES